VIDILNTVHCHRCLLLIAQLYVQADSSDYQGIRNLKRAFLEVLTADPFKCFLDQDNNLEEFVSLLHSNSIFNSNPLDYKAVAQHALTVELLHKLDEQLQEDLSLLRRIAKIVGEKSVLGLDLKAILKSGFNAVVDALRALFIFSSCSTSDHCFKLSGHICSFPRRRHLSQAGRLGEHSSLLDIG